MHQHNILRILLWYPSNWWNISTMFHYTIVPPARAQDFAARILLLINQYVKPQHKHAPPKIPPSKHNHHSLPSSILDNLVHTFWLTHLYFSSLLICPTNFLQYHSPLKRDILFGSLGPAFFTQWKVRGLAHKVDFNLLSKVIKWA